MKNRFKISAAALLLTATLLCSCGKLCGMKPSQAYNASREALSGATEYEITTERRVTSTDGLEVISSDKATYRRKGDRFYMQNADATNPLLNMEGWYVDGYSYASYRTMKIKTPTTLSEYVSSNGSASAYLPKIEDTHFQKLKFEGDDEKFITLTFSSAQYKEIFGELGIGGEIDGEITYTVYFDENASVTSTVTDFYMILSEARLHSVTKTVISLSSPDVSEPENADSFQLIENGK